MNFLVPSAVHQIYLISHFCSPDHPEYISVSRLVEPTILTVTCTTIPTVHACLARTRTRATPPHIFILHKRNFQDIPTAFHELWDSGKRIMMKC